MDSHSRQIVIALALIIALAVAAIAISLLVPYNVTFDAQIINVEGAAEILIPNRLPRLINASTTSTLRIGHTLKLEPGSAATIILSINGGRAIIEGPAEVRLVTSQRSATTIEHLRGDGEYSLAIEQDGGTVRYYFDHASPSIDDTDITIWINHTVNDTIVLTSPCWITEISASGTLNSAPLTCP